MEQKEFAFEIGETVLNLLNNFQGIVESRAFYGFENRYTVRNNDKSQLVGEWKLKSIRKVAPQVIKAALENDTDHITIQKNDNIQNNSPTKENSIQDRTPLTPKDQPLAVLAKEDEVQGHEQSLTFEPDESLKEEDSFQFGDHTLTIEKTHSEVKRFFQLTEALQKILHQDLDFEAAKERLNKKINEEYFIAQATQKSETLVTSSYDFSKSQYESLDVNKLEISEDQEAKETVQKDTEEKNTKDHEDSKFLSAQPSKDNFEKADDHLTDSSQATPNLQEKIHKKNETCPTIEEILPGDEFNQLRYYFKENNILTTMNLVGFELETLFYVPGIPEELVSIAIEIIRSYINYSPEIVQKPNTKITDAEEVIGHKEEEETILQEAPECNTQIKPTESPQTDVFEIPKEELLLDFPIAYAYINVPRSEPFIKYFQQNGKTLMSEITIDDFYKFKEMERFGNNTIENIYRIWTDFLHIRKDRAARDSFFMHKVFDELSCGNLFIRECNKIGIFSLADLLLYNLEAFEIPGISKKDLNKIHQTFLRSMHNPTIKAYLPAIRVDFIPEENQYISLKSLQSLGISPECLKNFQINGIVYARDFLQYDISHWEYVYARKLLDVLKTPLSQLITSFFSKLDERDKFFLDERISGKTLQQIGETNNITRERVRQITNKINRKAEPLIQIFNSVMIRKFNGVYSFDDIETFFRNDSIAQMTIFTLIELNLSIYLKFSHIFLDKSLISGDIQRILNQIAIEVIGEGVDYSKQIDAIESKLSEHSLEFLTITDFTNYLISSKYHFYGNFVTRGKASYALICIDAIKKHFEFDIKLDQDESNEDLLKLREIVRIEYPGITLPEENRSLSSRISFFLVLSGIGRYCPIEKIVYSSDIFEELFEYIETNDLTSFYYTELFSEFQGRFLAETNIDNAHFLHGLLKYLYPTAYIYEKGLLIKKGEERQDIFTRLKDIFLNTTGPITRNQIEKDLPGFNSWVITNSLTKWPEVIQWEYDEFIHLSNIEITPEEIDTIDQIISTQMNAYSGYTSEGKLFNFIKTELPQFTKRNKIKSSQNVFYIASKYLEGKYRFSRPHIVSFDFPETDLSISNIARYLLRDPNRLNYQELIDFAENVCWKKGSINTLTANMFSNYIRISENDYIKTTIFSLSESEIFALENYLSTIIPSSGYLAISNIFDYSKFPQLTIEQETELEWNGFLLESLIEEFNLGLSIVSPKAKDRRIQKGIIIKQSPSVTSFENVVINALRADNKQQLTEEEFIAFLKIKGLSNSSYLPQELYDCQNFVYSNEIFQLKNWK